MREKPKQKNYRFLGFTSALYRGFAALTLVMTGLYGGYSFVVTTFNSTEQLSALVVNWMINFGGALVGGLFASFTLFVFAQMISMFLDVNENMNIIAENQYNLAKQSQLMVGAMQSFDEVREQQLRILRLQQAANEKSFPEETQRRSLSE